MAKLTGELFIDGLWLPGGLPGLLVSGAQGAERIGALAACQAGREQLADICHHHAANRPCVRLLAHLLRRLPAGAQQGWARLDDAGAAHAAYTQVRTSGACLTLSAVAQARKLEMCLRMIEAAEEKRAASRGGGSARYYTHLLRLRPEQCGCC